MSISDELQRLADLHSNGALTDAEYQTAKEQVLGIEHNLLALDSENEVEAEFDFLEPFEEADEENLGLGIEPRQFTLKSISMALAGIALLFLALVMQALLASSC